MQSGYILASLSRPPTDSDLFFQLYRFIACCLPSQYTRALRIICKILLLLIKHANNCPLSLCKQIKEGFFIMHLVLDWKFAHGFSLMKEQMLIITCRNSNGVFSLYLRRCLKLVVTPSLVPTLNSWYLHHNLAEQKTIGPKPEWKTNNQSISTWLWFLVNWMVRAWQDCLFICNF